MDIAMMEQIMKDVLMMVVIVVDQTLTQIIVQIVSAMKIWTVQLHLIWLAMVFVTMNPTM